MAHFINEYGVLILSILGIIIAFFLTVIIVQFLTLIFVHLLKKRVLLVNREYYREILLKRDEIELKNNSMDLEMFSGLFESLSEVRKHKDKLVVATGESLKKLDNKIDSMSTTISNLEEVNKKLRNRDEVIGKIKTIKLLISTIEEIDKFIDDSKENYLEFIRDNIETVLIGIGVESYGLEYKDNEEFIKYYLPLNEKSDGELELLKKGFLVPLPEGSLVVKQAQIKFSGEIKS